MKNSIDQEKIFFNWFLAHPKYLSSINKNFFTNQDLDDVANLAKEFFIKFGEAPSKDQIKALIDNEQIQISNSIIESIFDVKIKEYDKDWIQRTAESWIKWQHFYKNLSKTIEYIKTQDVTPENVEDIVTRASNMVSNEGLISFDVDLGLNFFEPESHITQKVEKIQSGYNFIDNVMGGGYDSKSLVVYAGEQNVGKSIWLANDAANFVMMGKNVAFITAEMAPVKVAKRIGSNLLNIPMSEYEIKAKSLDFMRKRLERLSSGLTTPGELFIKEFPTSQGSVLDIDSYLKLVEEKTGLKIHVLVVDYINILANYRNVNSENTYMKIKQIAEDLRALAVKRDMLVISATQLNRGGWDSTEIKMENIAESAGLAHTVDVMYAIIQDSLMHADSTYWLKILKMRDGEGRGKKCKFNINYNFMKLSETAEIM